MAVQRKGSTDAAVPADRAGDNLADRRRSDGGVHRGGPPALAAAQVIAGALSHRYDIPQVTFRRKEARGLLLSSIVVAGWLSWHLGWQSLWLLACTAPATAFRAVSFVLSWFDRPV